MRAGSRPSTACAFAAALDPTADPRSAHVARMHAGLTSVMAHACAEKWTALVGLWRLANARQATLRSVLYSDQTSLKVEKAVNA